MIKDTFKTAFSKCISGVHKIGNVGEKPTHMAYLVLVTIESHHWYAMAAAASLACLIFASKHGEDE